MCRGPYQAIKKLHRKLNIKTDNSNLIPRSASDSSMDTSESQGSGKGNTPAPAGAAGGSSSLTSSAPLGDNIKESDVANMMAMGFPRDVCIQELRKTNGDVNLAIAAIFAKSLSDSFAKK